METQKLIEVSRTIEDLQTFLCFRVVGRSLAGVNVKIAFGLRSG